MVDKEFKSLKDFEDKNIAKKLFIIIILKIKNFYLQNLHD